MSTRLTTRVAINAQLIPSSGCGGVASVLPALVSALANLGGPEEFVLIAHPAAYDWLEPYLGPNQRIVVCPSPPDTRARFEGIKRVLGRARPAARQLWRAITGLRTRPRFLWIEESRGFLESLGCTVAHMPYQCYLRSSLPTVYNPHDLQHLHFPQFFDAATFKLRERVYRAGCRYAHTVVAGSSWIKGDLERQYGLSPEKIQVIPWAAPTQAIQPPTNTQLDDARLRFALPNIFAYYPAMIWEHKNHLRLLEALALLRDRDGVRINLVCTGAPFPPFWPRVEERLCNLDLATQVKFLGMVSPTEVRALYRLAQFVVVPTLFEAASGPVFEAWQEGAPVACSTVTSLPEQVGGAALLFDPFSVDEIADVLQQMASDTDLRARLVRLGSARLRDFSWERTALAYRAVYRRAAGKILSEEDRALLAWDWSRQPQRAESEKGNGTS